jgi:hypothetical protein
LECRLLTDVAATVSVRFMMSIIGNTPPAMLIPAAVSDGPAKLPELFRIHTFVFFNERPVAAISLFS